MPRQSQLGETEQQKVAFLIACVGHLQTVFLVEFWSYRNPTIIAIFNVISSLLETEYIVVLPVSFQESKHKEFRRRVEELLEKKQKL